jgi:transcriptional regulator with GAF, ATPase, and Fis domain
VGEDVTRTVDVRVIAATNQDLGDEVRARRFRQRPVLSAECLPARAAAAPSQERGHPAAGHPHHFESVEETSDTGARLTPGDIEGLRRYSWPGNVRELQNVIARAVILSKGVRLRLDIALPSGAGASGGPLWPSDNRDDVVLTDRECRDRERANVMRALERSAGRVYGRAGAAELLGINPTTLASRLRALKITLPTPRQSRSRVASSTRGVQRPRPRCLLRSRDRNSRIDRIVPPPLRAQRHSPRTGR